jgi:hypothetical protein
LGLSRNNMPKKNVMIDPHFPRENAITRRFLPYLQAHPFTSQSSQVQIVQLGSMIHGPSPPAPNVSTLQSLQRIAAGQEENAIGADPWVRRFS